MKKGGISCVWRKYSQSTLEAPPFVLPTARQSKYKKILTVIIYFYACTINLMCWSCPVACDHQDSPYHDKSRNDWYVISIFFTHVS